MTAKKRGRPPIPAKERKTLQIGVRFDIKERKKLEALCEEVGMTFTELVRFRLLDMTASERKALASGRFVRTPDGTKFAD